MGEIVGLGEIVDSLVCPECGAEEFFKGPHAGLSVNVKCSKCGYKLNITPLPNGKIWITDRLGK